ncbi:unnamed protein product [Rotaria socialis]
MSTSKPVEWVTALIERFEDQLPIKCGELTNQMHLNLEQNKECLISLSRFKFSLVINGLTDILKAIDNTRYGGFDQEKNIYESYLIVLDAVEQCLANTKDMSTSRLHEAIYVNRLLPVVCKLLNVPGDGITVQHVRQLASNVLFALSVNNFSTLFSKVVSRLESLITSGDETYEAGDLDLIQHMNVDMLKLTRLLNEKVQKWRSLKKIHHTELVKSVEKAIWNWLDTYPEEFTDLQKRPNAELSDNCEKLFELLDSFGESNRRKVQYVWPLQTMLLVLCPIILEELVYALEKGGPCSAEHLRKRNFVDALKRQLHAQVLGKQHSAGGTESAAVVTFVKLCKAATYINNKDSNNAANSYLYYCYYFIACRIWCYLWSSVWFKTTKLVYAAPNANVEICSSSLETYHINGSSILGKYSRAAVTVDNGECSKIGRQILEKNGTTMDAALAAAICNGVMNGHSMGIGGGCAILIYSKKRKRAFSLIGRERAPYAANATMFIGRENMSMTGGLAIAVPGELRAYKKAYDEFGGGVPWRDLFQPTIQLCRNGFIVSASQAAAIAQTRSLILNDPAMRELFVKNNKTNELYSKGDIMKRPKYAATLEIIAEQGADAFYTGTLADRIVKEIHDHGGIITKQDLADYQVDFNEALSVNLNASLTAFTTQAPSSGPLLIFILNILRGYNIAESNLKKTSDAALFYHRLIEAFKFAYAKRTELADPLKINITNLIRNLTSKDYADIIRARINDYKTFGFEYYGGTWYDQLKTGTAHLSVVGPDGDAVALTSTVNLYFGSKVVGPETGIIYNDEMDDFSIPNTTNFFGVPASPANFIAPGKRPVSSMSPLILLETANQRIQQVLGASGGTKITTSVAQVAMLNLWFNENIKQAIDAPRLHSQLLPQSDILKLLKKRGHNITCSTYGGSVIQGIEWRDEVNQYWANCDIRKGGAPDGFS